MPNILGSEKSRFPLSFERAGGYTTGEVGELVEEVNGSKRAKLEMGLPVGSVAGYVQGEEELYSVADAAQDRYLDILIAQAVENGKSVTATRQPWASA